MAVLELNGEWRQFGGWMKKYTHESRTLGSLQMCFFIYLPPQYEGTAVPLIYYLAGLTCTGENGSQKGYFTKRAAERGVAIVYPDTSPRGAMVEGEDDSYDFGTGAGFYLDATRDLWSKNYKMYSYITEELPSLISENFPNIDVQKCGIFGHSMGGHGALTIAFKNPDKYASVSAFAPICNPITAPWGKKAFAGYLGDNQSAWENYDACELMRRRGPFPTLGTILIDQGSSDQFLPTQLFPDNLKDACSKMGQELLLRIQPSYDHSYFFISTFAEDHINFHADALYKLLQK